VVWCDMDIVKGTYALLMYLSEDVPLQIGRLGCFVFPAGYYLYVGSALGPGGLRARLARHARREKARHWHIDYLLDVAELLETWEAATEERWECRWAEAAISLEGSNVPVARFGASDCRCPAHLIHFTQRPERAPFAARLPGLVVRARLLDQG